jgi:hypothetical protein
MATRTAFLMRSLHIFPILLSVICLLAAAEAQHGGGGGHSGGGHFGGGHSSGRHSGGSHAGGHFGWLHVGLGKHSGPHAKFEASSPSSSPHPPSHLPTPGLMPFRPRISPTLLWSPSLFPPHPGGRVSFVSSLVRPHHHNFLRNRFPRFTSSGCFFNGATEVCFFEPFLPLLSFSGDFDLFDSGFGFGGTRLTSATDLKNSRNRKCPRSRPLSIHRMTMQHTGIPHCVPEPDSGQQPKTEPLARESSCWC